MTDDLYAKVGEHFVEAPAVFELVLEDYVQYINPADYDLDAESINPADYFVTSGDATEKARILNNNIKKLCNKLRERCYNEMMSENQCSYDDAKALYETGLRPKNNGLVNYEYHMLLELDGSNKMLIALYQARGTNVFLETEWESHHLLCIPKNPRKVVPLG